MPQTEIDNQKGRQEEIFFPARSIIFVKMKEKKKELKELWRKRQLLITAKVNKRTNLFEPHSLTLSINNSQIERLKESLLKCKRVLKKLEVGNYNCKKCDGEISARRLYVIITDLCINCKREEEATSFNDRVGAYALGRSLIE